MLISDICRLLLAQYSSKIVLIKFSSGLCLELFWSRKGVTSDEITVDCLASDLSKRLAKEVLRLDVRDIALITRNMLCLDIVGGPTDPVLTNLRKIGVLYLLRANVLLRGFRVESPLGELWLPHSDVHVIVGGLVSLMSQNLVDISRCAAKYVILLRYMTCVAR